MAETYRVHELAQASGVSVDTIRYYQHRGLLDPPSRKGRVAFYSKQHLARIKRIRELQSQGLSLQTIKRFLDGIHPADAALVSAVTAEATMTLEEVADAAAVPLALLESLVSEGLLPARTPGAEHSYTEADVQAVRAGLALLEAGVPLSSLLELGRRYTSSVEDVAERAVALFDEYVRRPARSKRDEKAARKELVEAFERLLPAASTLVRHQFERTLLAAARRRIESAARDEP